MPKLKKADFNRTFRFRDARRGEHQKSLVNCVSCTSISGGTNDKEPAYCNHLERFRRVKIAEYIHGCFSRDNSHNISSDRVCDAYTPHPLPEGINLPILVEGQAIVLGTQWRDIYHASSSCSYVVEELRLGHAQTTEDKENERVFNKPKVEMRDISDLVPEETIGNQVCEMPCCDKKLPYHTWRVDSYRSRVGIKPDGKEEKPWVRKVIDHEKKVIITPEQLEFTFDLSRFQTLQVGFNRIHDRIIAVSDYLHKNCNRLGSRPLSEAVNPVYLDSSYHILDDPILVSNSGADVWVYDERLFDRKRIVLSKPLKYLEKIPEGIIPCMDAHKVFSTALHYCQGLYGSFGLKGIIKPLEDETLISRGLTHFLDIRAVSFHDTQHMWGEFGRGFNGLASFHEE